jgi:hypothetical protein
VVYNTPKELVSTELTPEAGFTSGIQHMVSKVTGEQTDQGTAQCNSQQVKECRVVVNNSTEVLHEFDLQDARLVQDKGLISDGTQTFVRLCKELSLPFEEHGLYWKWLVEYKGINKSVLPTESYAKVPPDVNLTYPSGAYWRSLREQGSRKSRRALHIDFDMQQQAEDLAVQWIESQVKCQSAGVAQGGQFAFNIQQGKRAMMTGRDLRKMQTKSRARKSKTAKAVAAGRDPNPANVRAALGAEDGEDWVDSMGDEFFGLVKAGVFELGFTQQQLLDMDITAPPVPCGPYFERKYGVDGEPTKKKCRIAVKGHPGNMQKGVHFDKTFSATPQECTARMLCAMIVLFNMFRGAFDITKAFCWATLPPGDQIALEYPEGFKEFNATTKEPLFMILRKNLYGHPAAGRQYGKQRDSILLIRFNELCWTCLRTRMDPCLFLITRFYDGEKQWGLMLVHS